LVFVAKRGGGGGGTLSLLFSSESFLRFDKLRPQSKELGIAPFVAGGAGGPFLWTFSGGGGGAPAKLGWGAMRSPLPKGGGGGGIQFTAPAGDNTSFSSCIRKQKKNSTHGNVN